MVDQNKAYTAKDIDSVESIATHDGRFHSDDVFSVASVTYLNPKIEVLRTRNPEALRDADLRIDVGGKYDPETGDYDHHQKGGAGARENGVPYASFGLIWNDYGSRVSELLMRGENVDEDFIRQIGIDPVSDPEKVAALMDEILVQPIDNYDVNGPPLTPEGQVKPIYLQNLVNSFGDTFHTASNDNFDEAVRYAQENLKRWNRQAHSGILAEDIWDRALEENKQDGFVVLDLDRFVPYQSLNDRDVLYCVQKAGQNYVVLSLSGPDGLKKPLPDDWQGLRGSDLSEATGVSDTTFMNKDFSIYASSLDGAITLAKKAVDYKRD